MGAGSGLTLGADPIGIRGARAVGRQGGARLKGFHLCLGAIILPEIMENPK